MCGILTAMHIAGYGKMFKSIDEQLDAIPTPEAFTQVVLLLVARYGLSHFDAILELCERHEREYESIRPLLTPTLKLALLEESSRLRLLRDSDTFLSHKLG